MYCCVIQPLVTSDGSDGNQNDPGHPDNEWAFRGSTGAQIAFTILLATSIGDTVTQSTAHKRDCESFARRTFTTPKIRTFTTPKFGHFPPPKKNICQEDNCHPQFFSSFFGALFLAFSTYSSWRTSRMGRRRCLTRWSWSTSSRGCVTRWSWSTSSRRCLTSWSWSTSSRGRRWKRSPRW